MDKRVEKIADIRKNWGRYRELRPGMSEIYDMQQQEAFSDGKLDAKTKRMIAVAIAVTHGCMGCMLGNADMAVKAGATGEEILEACSVSISLGGTMAGSRTGEVVAYLEERGLL
ncbi:MAG: carboxymuconolactone decarboxylase family protein [Desulfovibrionaceae bacterium]|nr:carboxymuconolactone decarboxylase family protein [Desulfovibrionaceae bacterium]